MNFADAKENYLKKHCRDKDYDVEKFDDIWLVGGDKLKEYRTVIVVDRIFLAQIIKIHIKGFVNLLCDRMKEKFPEVKMVFYIAKELITYIWS